MSKHEIKQQIDDLLKGPAKDYVLVSFQDVYTIISEGKASEITINEACKFIKDNRDIQIQHIILNQKKWNAEKSRLVGPEPDENLPEILQGLPNVEVSETFEARTVQILIDLWRGVKKDYVKISEPLYSGSQCIEPGEIRLMIPD